MIASRERLALSRRKKGRFFLSLGHGLLLTMALCVLFSGCIEGFPHTRGDVMAYLVEQLPGEDITVAWRFYEEDTHDGETKRVWDCYFTDLPEVVFQVYSSCSSAKGVPVSEYTLGSNVWTAIYLHYLEQYRAQGGNLDAWEIDGGNLRLEYDSLMQIYPAAKQIQAFFDWYTAQPHAGKPWPADCILAAGQLPLLTDSNVYVSYQEEHAADFTTPYGQVIEGCVRELKRYHAFYAIPCADFSEEELEAYAQKEWDWPSYQYLDVYPYPDDIRRGEERLPREIFAGIGVEGSWISYGGFFEMANRLGLSPEGTPEHFVLTGVDGCRYEFSYGFCQEGEEGPRWYYTRDGEVVESEHHTDASPVLCLSGESFPAITGVKFFYD